MRTFHFIDSHGKTTALRAIAGLQACIAGSVSVGGQDVVERPDRAARCLGFVPDDSPMYPTLTTLEFLDHFARLHRLPNRDTRIEQCLDLVWLTEKREALCGTLSRGMKQRLMLAKALLHDPPLLVLDEPASGLDPLGRIDLRKLIVRLREDGKAVLVSSHILADMQDLATHVAIMERGRLVLSGALDELLKGKKGRRIRVRWRLEHDGAAALITATPAVSDAELDRLGGSFAFSGSDDELHTLLASLIGTGVRVSEWHEEASTLEDVFVASGIKALA